MARIASAAKGVVTQRELLAAGVTRAQIRHRLRVGSLIPEFRGVYRVGHRAPSLEARYMAAVRACGEGAVLSHGAAAFWLALLKGKPPPAEVLTRTAHRVPGLTTHRCRGSLDGTSFKGIPVTSVPRTLVDLAGMLPLDALARACHEAGVLHGTKPRDVQAVLARRANSRGAAKLRVILVGDARVTLSRLERAFLDLLIAHGFPLPEMNRVAGGRRVDCRWPRLRLTVELDSYRFHHSRHAWEQDREREARERGDEFRRFTYGDVVESPGYVVAELRGLLARTRTRPQELFT